MLKRWLSVSKTSKKKQISKKKEASEQNESLQDVEPLRTIVSVASTTVNTNNGDDQEKNEENDRRISSKNETDFISQSVPDKPDRLFDDKINSSDELIDSEKYETVFDDTFDDKITRTIISEEEIYNNISFIEKTDLMPYGNGSNKIFGYENFGNTCYCNSVLQCLYHIPEFRFNILKYPLRPSNQSVWKQKTEMPGKIPRIFTEQSFEKNMTSKIQLFDNTDSNNNININNDNINNTNMANIDIQKHNENKSDNNDSKLSTSGGRKLLSGWLKYSNKNVDQESNKLVNQLSSNENQEEASDLSGEDQENISNENGDSQIPLSTQSRNPSRYKRIIVGRCLPAISITNHNNNHLSLNPERERSQVSNELLVQANEKSTELSNDQRKKRALILGPILNVDHSIFNESKPNLYSALKDIFESITENESLTGVVSPTRFIHILKKENVLFNTMMHQDAHEFLNFLLNDLSEYADSNLDGFQSVQNNSNFIKHLFQGTQSSRIKCLTCDSVTTNNEPFLDFPIEVNENETTDIQRILHEFHQREILNSGNKFYCNVCCGLQEAERVVGIEDLPHVLALHLKRFKYSEEKNTNIKLFNRIEYPLVLDVHPTFDQSVAKRYELVGLVIHMGGGPQHGHYVSLCKTEKFGWLFFDDETVETVEESTVLKFTGDGNNLTTAYVLFYKEIDPNVESVKLFDKDPTSKREYQENIDSLLKYDSIERQKRTESAITREHGIEYINNSPNNLDGSEAIYDSTVIAEGNGNDMLVSNKSRRSRLFSFMKKGD